MTNDTSISHLANDSLLRSKAELVAYHDSPLPSDRDTQIAALIDAYGTLSPEERVAFARGLTAWQLGTLSSFFDRMAMVSVRTGSVETLVKAAVALAISHFGSDPRELLMALPILCRACDLLDTGVEPFLQAAAEAPSADTANVMRDYTISFSAGCGELPSYYREINGPRGIIWINKTRPVPDGW